MYVCMRVVYVWIRHPHSIFSLQLLHLVSCIVSSTDSRSQPDMIGYYLGEFALTYTPITHGRPGVGATSASKFIPLK